MRAKIGGTAYALPFEKESAVDQELRLFKYFPPARTDVLRTGRICFSSPLNLNDPFELKPPMQLFESEGEMAEAVLTKLYFELMKNPPKLPEELEGKFTQDEYIELMKLSIQQKLPGFMERLAPGIEEGYSRFYSLAEERMGMLCLTESPDDLLMWAHYAAAHTGRLSSLTPCTPFSIRGAAILMRSDISGALSIHLKDQC